MQKTLKTLYEQALDMACTHIVKARYAANAISRNFNVRRHDLIMDCLHSLTIEQVSSLHPEVDETRFEMMAGVQNGTL